jgi:hypothetical protein
MLPLVLYFNGKSTCIGLNEVLQANEEESLSCFQYGCHSLVSWLDANFVVLQISKVNDSHHIHG